MGRHKRLYEEQIRSGSLEDYMNEEEDIVPNEEDEKVTNEEYEETIGDYDISKYNEGEL